jgi:micrococcal nuclease
MGFRVSVLSLASCVLMAFNAVPASAKAPIGTLEGMVVNVSDGEHLTISNNGTDINVHLYGIHAPVITRVNKSKPWLSEPGQPYAGRAFMALSNKVLHQHVKLEIMRIDRHGRTVAIVLVDGHNINHEMVAEGWAWACQKHKSRHNDLEYIHAEEEARAKKLGLWAQSNPQPPWEFKKMAKAEKGLARHGNCLQF